MSEREANPVLPSIDPASWANSVDWMYYDRWYIAKQAGAGEVVDITDGIDAKAMRMIQLPNETPQLFVRLHHGGTFQASGIVMTSSVLLKLS